MTPGGRRGPQVGPAIHNRRTWDRQSDAYDHRCAAVLGGRTAMAWGLFRIPESRARWLGPVRGRRVLEVGCGAGRWAIALRRRGARIVGLDLSVSQLDKARRESGTAGVRLPLVRGNVESLPFRDGVFDLVFCDWGALSFADPRRSIPECARVLRRGGHLVFATGSVWSLVALDERADRFTRRFRAPYFGPLRRWTGDLYEFRPTMEEWVGIFGDSGLVVERLAETRATPAMRSRYLSSADQRWARRWPAELIWRVRRS